jgi:hypothetical protein
METNNRWKKIKNVNREDLQKSLQMTHGIMNELKYKIKLPLNLFYFFRI